MVLFMLRPHEGIGPIHLGSARDRVMRWLGGPTRSVTRGMTSCADSYPGLHVVYDVADRVRSVEVFAPHEVALDGRLLLSQPLVDVENYLRTRFGEDVWMEDQVLDVRRHGIRLHVEGGAIVMVIASVHGWYASPPPREAW